METRPAPLDALAGNRAGLDAFRVAAEREIVALLRELCDGSVPLNLNASNGNVYTTTLWTLDAERSSIGFCADIGDPRMQALLESEEAVVVGYLNNVKVQFEVANLVLVRGNRASVLRCAAPRELFRFQRVRHGGGHLFRRGHQRDAADQRRVRGGKSGEQIDFQSTIW